MLSGLNCMGGKLINVCAMSERQGQVASEVAVSRSPEHLGGDHQRAEDMTICSGRRRVG